MERLGAAVPLDGWCFSTADPQTLVMTSHATSGIDRSGSPLLYLNEYGERDVSKHEELARSSWPVRVLSEATRGERERSPRYRSVLRPMGIEHELRAAVRERGVTWGFLHLFRGRDRRDFDAVEATLVERFARGLAPVLRRALLGEQASPAPGAGRPAVILLDARNRLVEGTAGGEAWGADLRDAELDGDAVPEVFVTLAIWARSLLAQGSDAVPRARVPGANGAWYTASAMCTDRDRVAVVLQPAQPAELVHLMLSRFALTPAERQVTELVLEGRSTRQIAERLVVSPHTVQDHLKSIFSKADVRSRRDLVARLTGAMA
jgi:DNA-binding CsgD family transcriptional regulator